MVGEPLASVLRSGRELFNAKFVQARRRYPNLDSQAFSAFLASTLDPVARQLPLSAEELSLFVQSAYDVALELAGEGLLRRESNAPSLFSRAWIEILTRVPPAILSSGETVLGSISNAVHHLERADGARTEEWIRDLAAVAVECETLGEFLQAGQVLAWQAGLAHYRRGALEVAGTLREPIMRAVLRIPPTANADASLERLKTDVWFDPSEKAGANQPRVLRPIRRVGAFRGFGGNFLVPPLVAAAADQLFVSSGEDTWLLTADVFGHALHRATTEEFEMARKASTSAAAKVQITTSQITTTEGTTAIAVPGTVTSIAVLSHTIAITSSSTHAIQLLAR